jgi:hypothetical protein
MIKFIVLKVEKALKNNYNFFTLSIQCVKKTRFYILYFLIITYYTNSMLIFHFHKKKRNIFEKIKNITLFAKYINN